MDYIIFLTSGVPRGNKRFASVRQDGKNIFEIHGRSFAFGKVTALAVMAVGDAVHVDRFGFQGPPTCASILVKKLLIMFSDPAAHNGR